ncbi:hypothetical protein HPP92_006218 [Vanilla planifolia]|uniref:EF-hand domain-containing protein n=1 Tax=Vanilla planifolia TaxID=51239 RepID=A0A835RTI3_VANPL|nr:hypothetical protein HPP92_006218 [Vanilla planifolia]
MGTGVQKSIVKYNKIDTSARTMRIISCPTSFFCASSKKKSRGDATPPFPSASFSSDEQSNTPKSVLSKPRRQRRRHRKDHSWSSSTSDGERSKVTRRELEVVLRRLGPEPPTEEEVAAMLAEADWRGNGQFSMDEIAALGLDEGGPASPGLIKETFMVFDKDGDGRISAEELLGLFATLGDEGCTLDDCRRMIGLVDTDANGFVCFADFVRMMEGRRC